MMNLTGGFPVDKPVSSIKLSVEALPESKIQEISLDGSETYFRPLTMSENLCKMATKIDFLAEEEGRAAEEDEEDDIVKKTFQNRWPWEGIRNHLQQALTEISVLTDVLTIAHNKGPPKKEGVTPEGGKYMMFDHARKELAPVKLNLQLPAKKKGLNSAAEILSSGEKRLKAAGDEMLPEMGYHFQLFKLRKYWRIRRVGAKVLGDLSYRSAGSDFWHTGNFEVIKTTDDDIDDEEKSIQPSTHPFPHSQMFRPKQKPALKVVVGADLKGTATIKIGITRGGKPMEIDVATETMQFHIDGLVNDNEPEWHKTLCYAQNVLFCRGLFNKLAKQAIQLKSTTTLTPFLVVGNKITAYIFPETSISIELVHITDPSKNPPHRTDTASDDIFSFKLAAMKLLLDQYRKLSHIPAPHPACATFGLTKVQRKAPTHPFAVSQMQRVTDKESVSLIDRLVLMAKHWELKLRVCEVVEILGALIQDPYIQAQWSTLGNPTETTVWILIMSAGYEACNRTLVDMSVGTDTVRAVQKDGRIVKLSSDLHHMRGYLLLLLCSHQLNTAQEVFVILGWTIQHFSHHCGVGPRAALGSVGAIMARSPTGNSSVSVRCWVEKDGDSPDEYIKYEVHVQTVRSEHNERMMQTSHQHRWINSELNAIQDPKWSLLGGEWREVDWVKLYGKHFIGKLETLLTFFR